MKQVSPLTLTLIAALSILLVAIVVLACQYKSLYIKYNASQLDPLGLHDQDEVADPQDLELAILGDSRAKHWASALDGSGRYRIANLGVAGQTSAQIRYRFVQQADNIRAQIIVIQLGINDLKQIALLPGHKEHIVAECITNIMAIIDMARQSADQVVITTIFPRSKLSFARHLVWSDEVDNAVREVNDVIRGVSLAGVAVMDTAQMISEDGLTPEKYAVDTLHINQEGYAYLDLDSFLSQL